MFGVTKCNDVKRVGTRQRAIDPISRFLLDREPQPCGVVHSSTGEIVAANQKLGLLLGGSGAIPLNEGVRRELANARQAALLTQLIVPSPRGELTLIAELRPMTSPSPFVFLLVTTWSLSIPQGPVADLVYEISTRDFGRVTGSTLPMWQGKVLQGAKCHEAIMGRSTPCPQCPAEQLGPETDRRTSIVKSRKNGAYLAVARAATADAVQVGLCALDASLAGRFLDAYVEDVAEDKLSTREVEVVRLLLRGCTTSEVADKLGVTPSTAKFHVANVFRKLGVQSRSELLRRFLRDAIDG